MSTPAVALTSPDHVVVAHRPHVDTSFHNGRISRFNAWFFRAFQPVIAAITRDHRTLAFRELRVDGTVVELGAGTGANLGLFPSGTALIAVEPSRAMHDTLVRRAAARGIDLTLIAGGAERLPLPDASVDEVICTLVMCTVEDPEQVLREVHRVLRPGGQFRFVEHVAAPRWSIRRVVQRLVAGPWSWLFEGCDTARDTVALVRAAGFRRVETEHRRLRRSPFYPVNSGAWGIATR